MSERNPIRSVVDGRNRFKVTKTTTDSDGKIKVESIEMTGEDAVKFMHSLTLRNPSPSDGNHSTVRSLVNASVPKSTVESKKSTSTNQEYSDFAREALEIHNELRRKHGVAPLTLNNELSKLAQDWAEHLAVTGSLTHSKSKYRDERVGENLRSQSWPVNGKEMTESWYQEIQKFDFSNRQNYQPGTGHFTQIVWKNSEEVGFGRAQGTSMNFAVAMYYPAGNYLGEYETNIFPPV